ncbi:AraC family transcriptional regulator [Halobacillus salinarum]|uniref:AraC family transcriptional regulator n=1 Tax=Halobacillus salinarum TaxID=2932257 RepID=A0ABY4EJ53_9BACI|nr:AraC family transcriptional regulator [Halobacillus salinarum]UOQ44179.1 AraC family transcriptional regulator [Halobacillus salinarum]
MNEKMRAFYRVTDDVGSQHNFRYHSHDRFEIYFFHTGHCKYLIGNKVHHLQENDLIIMNGLTLHCPKPQPGTTYVRSVIEFSAEWVKPVLNHLNVPELLTPFKTLSYPLFRGVAEKDVNEIKTLIKNITLLDINSLDRKKNSLDARLKEGEASALLVQLLFKIYELSKLRLVETPSHSSEKSDHVNRIRTWIDDHFQKALTLDKIAASLNISKYYMARTFKDSTGYTIMRYIMNCRLNHAKYLLEIYPAKSILDVAVESGFDNSSHFSRYFRKHVNITPTEYRNQKAGRYHSHSVP